MNSKGEIFGTTEYVGGSLFRISNGVFEILHRFRGGAGDGWQPAGALFIDQNDTVYGTTVSGGSADLGTVFTYDAEGQFRIIASLPGGEGGSYAGGGVVKDPATGTVYGVAASGGAFGCGTVYKLEGPTHQVSTVHSFTREEGCSPSANLTFYQGRFHGTTSAWGPDGSIGGTLFSMMPSGEDFVSYRAPLYAEKFTAGVAADGKGGFWTGTYYGGLNGDGTLIYQAPDGVATTRYNFKGRRDGAKLYGTPLVGLDGMIYGGTVSAGTTQGCGTLFRFDPTSNTLTTLYKFRYSADGCSALAGLIQDGSGVLYGVLQRGGSGKFGTVFKFTP